MLKRNKCRIMTYGANILSYITICIFCSKLDVLEYQKLKCENTVVRKCICFIKSKTRNRRGRVD